MCVLIFSCRPETHVMARGHHVDTIRSRNVAQWCETGEEAISHVASLNAWNEPGAEPYEHFFIYPDDVCPYEEKNTETGEVKYKEHCLPMSQTDIDLDDEEGGIPEHLRMPIETKERELWARVQKERK